MMDFLAMGGYAVYLWPSYAAFFGCLLWAWGTAVRRERRIAQRIRDDLEQSRT